MSSFSRQQLEAWLKTIHIVSGRVLDIGGSQNPLNGRLKTFRPSEYKILDLEQPHECKQKPDIICDINDDLNGELFEIGSFEVKQNELMRISREYFDIVFCIEVTEYMWNPYTALQNLQRFLKKGGILYISFHFLYPVHNPHEVDYLRYTPAGCRKLLKEAGFEILEEKPRLLKTNMYWQQMVSTEGMRPSKEYGHHEIEGLLIKAKKI